VHRSGTACALSDWSGDISGGHKRHPREDFFPWPCFPRLRENGHGLDVHAQHGHPSLRSSRLPSSIACIIFHGCRNRLWPELQHVEAGNVAKQRPDRRQLPRSYPGPGKILNALGNQRLGRKNSRPPDQGPLQRQGLSFAPGPLSLEINGLPMAAWKSARPLQRAILHQSTTMSR